MSQNVTLSKNQRDALTALLSSPNVTAAAAACGLTPRTIHRYLEDDYFKAVLRATEGQMIDNAARTLVRGQQKALGTLNDIMDSTRASFSDKRLAAVSWLTLALKYRELGNLEDRLAALETTVYGKDN